MAFTEDQIAQLSAPLDRRHVKSRQQAGRNLSYIEGWHAIAEANRIFGFDNWTRETVDLRCVVERETKLRSGADAWRVAYICKARVIVDIRGDAVSREGTGYGSGIDQDLGAAHESAAKEAETDAMKRALMTFGSQFGLALYDKTQAEVSDGTAQSGMVDSQAGVRSTSGNSREGERPSPRKEVVPPEPRRSSPPVHNAQPPSHVTAGASVPPKETAAQRIVREIREAKFTATINTILAGNHSKMERWAADSEEGKAVVAGIKKLADDRITELSV